MTEHIDIVLPCYNPNSSWPDELLKFDNYIRPHFTINYIIVNDGSVTGDINSQIHTLTQKNIPVTRVSYDRNQGKGYALREGVKKSKAPFTLYTDIDFPFTNKSMEDMLHTLTSGKFDIVAGYRNENYYEKTISGFRIALSKSFRFFIRKVLRMPISDTQCGLKGFNEKGKTKFLDTTINRYLFDFEFIYTSVKDKTITIAPVQVELKDNVVFSKMKGKILAQETMNLLKVLLFSRR